MAELASCRGQFYTDYKINFEQILCTSDTIKKITKRIGEQPKEGCMNLKVKNFLLGSLFLAGVVAHADQAEFKPGEYVVKLKNTTNILSIKSIEAELGGVVIKRIPNSQIITLKRNRIEVQSEVLRTLNSVAIVEKAEPNYIYHINRIPNDPDLSKLWGLKNEGQEDSNKSVGVTGVDVAAEKAWDIETGSDNVLVAVIDTGLDYNHNDLKANAWTNESEANGKAGVDDDGNGYIDDIHGYDFANKDADPMDDHGHGSHVSGTIGATGDDGQGIVGVAWKVKIMGLKFLGADGSGSLDDALASIKYATKMGVNIMSNSWGGGGASDLMKEAIAESNNKNIIFTAAAGNHSGDNDANPSYPASYDVPNVISVAAVNNIGTLAYFSCYGKRTVHVSAPGVNVYSSTPSGYASWSGTSMATPHVSGVVALLLSHEPNLTPVEVRERLIKTSSPLGGLKNKVAANGMVNAFLALTNQVAPPDLNDPSNWLFSKEISISTPHPYNKNSNLSWEVEVSDAKDIALYFSQFDTEARYDKVAFYNREGKKIAEMDGNFGEGWSPAFPGNYVKVEFKSDGSVQRQGFEITKVGYR
jgi:subtilisin family serine protease